VLSSYAPDSARGLSQNQQQAALRTKVQVLEWDGQVPPGDLVIDALLGFGASGVPRPPVQAMIETANRSEVQLLALDVPSGLDAGSGKAPGACIAASATVTLALAKTGLLAPSARPMVGRLFLADIGVPPALLKDLGIDAEGLFAADDILELDTATGEIKNWSPVRVASPVAPVYTGREFGPS
jgi:hypothetical protein